MAPPRDSCMKDKENVVDDRVCFYKIFWQINICPCWIWSPPRVILRSYSISLLNKRYTSLSKLHHATICSQHHWMLGYKIHYLWQAFAIRLTHLQYGKENGIGIFIETNVTSCPSLCTPFIANHSSIKKKPNNLINQTRFNGNCLVNSLYTKTPKMLDLLCWNLDISSTSVKGKVYINL